MKKYKNIKKLEPEEFRRLTGVKPRHFFGNDCDIKRGRNRKQVANVSGISERI